MTQRKYVPAIIALLATAFIAAKGNGPTYPIPDPIQNESLNMPRAETPLTRDEYDWDDSWDLRRHYDYTYDNAGVLLSIMQQGYFNGEPSYRQRHDNTYNLGGTLQMTQHYQEQEEDWTLQRVDSYAYNAQDQLTTVYFYDNWISPDDHGEPSGRSEYEYNANGQVRSACSYQMYIEFEYMSDACYYYYNAQGQLEQTIHAWASEDWYLDHYHTTLHYYNPEGNLDVEYDFPTGNNLDSPGCGRAQYIYDANGFLIRKDLSQRPYDGSTDFEPTGALYYTNDFWGRHLDEIRQYRLANGEWMNYMRIMQTFPPLDNDDPSSPPPARLTCHPNPFAREVEVRFELKESGPIILDVYNLRGQCVRRLLSRDLTQGEQRVAWDGRDDAGSRLPVGIYLIRAKTAKGDSNVKVVLQSEDS